MKAIQIISGPVRSGKTTALMKQYSDEKRVGGILSPDVNGLRMLYNLRTKEYFPFQTQQSQTGVITVGRFHFLRSAFEHARQILLNEMLLCPDHLIIDEVGKLEVNQHSGFEPALSQVIQWYQENELGSELILVIRDTLVQEAKEKYRI